MAEVREVPEQFTTDFQGNTYVLLDGLLALAHEDGLKEADTEILMGPSEKNNHSWIMKAKVVTEKGTFYGIGDANEQNVNRNIAKHVIRMAETRATARALRKAVNVGMTAIEELGGDDAPAREERNGGQRQQRQQSGGAQRGGARKAQKRDPELISKADAGRMRWLLSEMGADIPGFEAKRGIGNIEEMDKERGRQWLEAVEKRYEKYLEDQEPEEEAESEEEIELNEADFEDIPF